MKVAVLGNGGFGTAMALVAHRAGHEVAVWGHDATYTASIAATRENPRYLPGVTLPAAIRVGSDAAAVLAGAETVLVAVPTQHVRSALSPLAALVPAGVPVVSLAKGLEQSSALRPSQVLRAVLGANAKVLVLSGPSHAEEVGRGMPCAVVLAGEDATAAHALQAALSGGPFRIYRNKDLLGVELCGALKNVMAVAAGIADGLGYGDNAKAAILSRGIVEMARYGVAEGADLHTFFGLAGMGDLAVTAFSRHGRNRAFGERIGKGETVDRILATTRTVAEGVWTARVVAARARELAVEMPICDGVCRVLFGGVPAAQAVSVLLDRDKKDEVLRF